MISKSNRSCRQKEKKEKEKKKVYDQTRHRDGSDRPAISQSARRRRDTILSTAVFFCFFFFQSDGSESFPFGQLRTTTKTRCGNYHHLCEPVWPSGKAALLKKVVVCGHCLVTLSITINETLIKWLSSPPILMRGGSVAIGTLYIYIKPLSVPLPPPPFARL